jgi:DNA-binding CsgD family transcriptional regulator
VESSSAAAARRRGELLEQGVMTYKLALDLVGGVVDREDLESVDAVASCDLRTLDGQLAILGGLMRERLADAETPLSREYVVAVSNALHELHTARFGIHDHLGHERLRRLDELDRGLSQLRLVTDQDQLLENVCQAAAESCGFDRVMLSKIDEDTWRPWHSYARTIGVAERSFLEWMRELPEIQLSHMMLESELVRRREPALVDNADTDARVYRPLVIAANQTSYVAAPIVSGDRVIGLLHADNGGRTVVGLDRDVLWFFAIGFAQIFERAVLLARLRDQRAEVMQAMKAVEAVLDELASTEVELATRDQATALTVSRPIRPVVTERPAVLEGLLTSRELEVLALMATGATNDRIAQKLVIGTQTVKSHVKQILRKLRVENRAEAISQYLRLTIGARDD